MFRCNSLWGLFAVGVHFISAFHLLIVHIMISKRKLPKERKSLLPSKTLAAKLTFLHLSDAKIATSYVVLGPGSLTISSKLCEPLKKNISHLQIKKNKSWRKQEKC
jgi:hypothetical protein